MTQFSKMLSDLAWMLPSSSYSPPSGLKIALRRASSVIDKQDAEINALRKALKTQEGAMSAKQIPHLGKVT